jgi:uncharacterized delta-60 repeat protein
MKSILLSISLLFSTLCYTQDAAPDPTFGTDGLMILQPGTSHDNAQDVVALPDGKILVAGVSDAGNFDFNAVICRLNNDGSLDNNFGLFGWHTVDMGVGPDYFYEMVVLEDGSILLCGAYSVTLADTDVMVVKLTSNGAIDESFGGGDGMFTYAISPGEEYLHDLVILEDGSIIVAGSATTPSFAIRGLVMKLTSAGELDESFGNSGYTLAGAPSDNSGYFGVDLDDQENILLAGYADVSFQYYTLVSMLDSNGDPLSTFNDDGHLIEANTSRAFDVKWNNYNILVCGTETFGAIEAYIASYLPDGTINNAFGTAGIAAVQVSTTNVFLDIAITPDGMIVAAGSSGPGVPSNLDYFVCRFNEFGSNDNTFGNNGQFVQSIGDMWEEINAVSIDSDNKILLGGFMAATNTDMAIMRLGNDSTNNIQQQSTNFQVYPNPAEDFVIINSSASESICRIRTSTGLIISETRCTQTTNRIDIQFLPKGVYVITLESGTEVRSEKLIIS